MLDFAQPYERSAAVPTRPAALPREPRRGKRDFTGFRFRRATLKDIPVLKALHRASMFGLGADHYSRAELEGYFAEVTTVDEDLIRDGTYFVAEAGTRIAASGGWTMRLPSYAALVGMRAAVGRPATVRSIFVHPEFARQGLGGALLERSETEAVLIGGADRIELCSTRSGYPVYTRAGYRTVAPVLVPFANGAVFESIRMVKDISTEPLAAAA